MAYQAQNNNQPRHMNQTGKRGLIQWGAKNKRGNRGKHKDNNHTRHTPSHKSNGLRYCAPTSHTRKGIRTHILGALPYNGTCQYPLNKSHLKQPTHLPTDQLISLPSNSSPYRPTLNPINQLLTLPNNSSPYRPTHCHVSQRWSGKEHHRTDKGTHVSGLPCHPTFLIQIGQMGIKRQQHLRVQQPMGLLRSTPQLQSILVTLSNLV
ncbi:unnamed protein product [Arctogadus glacialis]